MAKWKCFLLLLTIIVCFDSKVTQVKTIRSGPDVTPICTNTTQSPITLIVCSISTERGEDCQLLYHYTEDFVFKCDPRFTLKVANQTAYLHLASLTPADSGDYFCECSHLDGTRILHLNITVEEDEDASTSTQIQISRVLISVTIVIIITAVVFSCIYRSVQHGQKPEQLSSLPNMEPADIEPYSTFIQRDNGLYSAVRIHVCNTDINNSNMSTREDTHSGKYL